MAAPICANLVLACELAFGGAGGHETAREVSHAAWLGDQTTAAAHGPTALLVRQGATLPQPPGRALRYERCHDARSL